MIKNVFAAIGGNLLNPSNLPLQTEGSRIVNKNGDTVRLACVNWYGAHMERYVVNGLDMQNIDTLSGLIS